MSLKFELRPVHDALIPQYPGMDYTPPDDGETQPVRIRRVPACISLICIFLLSFGLMLSAASCNKDDGSGGSETVYPASSGNSNESGGQNDEKQPDMAYCLGDDMIKECWGYRCEESSCFRRCMKSGWVSNGCITTDEGLASCDCKEEGCTWEDNFCKSDQVIRYCDEDGIFSEASCSQLCDLGGECKNTKYGIACECYSDCEGEYEECTSSDYYCVDEDTYFNCDDDISCTEECAKRGKISAGCVEPGDGKPLYCDCVEAPDGDEDSDSDGEMETDGDDDIDGDIEVEAEAENERDSEDDNTEAETSE